MEVKTKPNKLLLYTKSTQDYNTVLSEIQTAKLECHTYPLPDAIQTRLVLKGIPPNVPEEDIREALMTNDIHTEKIYQITKTDKTTREVLTKYPVFVTTFSPGTDTQKVLQITRLCHCIIQWENTKTQDPSNNATIVKPLDTLQLSVAKLLNVSNVNLLMQQGTARNPSGLHRNAPTAKAPTRPISPVAHGICYNYNINNKTRKDPNPHPRSRNKPPLHSNTDKIIPPTLKLQRTHHPPTVMGPNCIPQPPT